MSSTGSGADFLNKRSALNQKRETLSPVSDVVVIDDEHLDADRMLATLRVIFGYDVTVRRASSINAAIDLVMEKAPDLVFLDDILKPSDDATHTIPYLRRAGYAGPIVVVSGQVTRTRRHLLISTGASEVIHKDDVDSVRLSEVMQSISLNAAAPDQPKKNSKKKTTD